MKHKFPLTILLVAAHQHQLLRRRPDGDLERSHHGKPSGIETSYLSNDHIRHSESKGTDMIIDLKTGTMTNIDVNKKTYYLVTRADMEAMQARMSERMNDPKVKQMMGRDAGHGHLDGRVGGSEEDRGVTSRGQISCEEWAITMGGMMNITECVTNDFKYPAQSWAALGDFNASMRKSMEDSAPARSPGRIWPKNEKHKGVPGGDDDDRERGVS